MQKVTPRHLSKAVVVWTGWGTKASWPVRTEAPLIKRFGAETAAMLIGPVRQLAADCSASDAVDTAHTTVEMMERASDDLRAIHPEISEKAIQALAWCYSWDWK